MLINWLKQKFGKKTEQTAMKVDTKPGWKYFQFSRGAVDTDVVKGAAFSSASSSALDITSPFHPLNPLNPISPISVWNTDNETSGSLGGNTDRYDRVESPAPQTWSVPSPSPAPSYSSDDRGYSGYSSTGGSSYESSSSSSDYGSSSSYDSSSGSWD